jgi:hypothetical protein
MLMVGHSEESPKRHILELNLVDWYVVLKSGAHGVGCKKHVSIIQPKPVLVQRFPLVRAISFTCEYP